MPHRNTIRHSPAAVALVCALAVAGCGAADADADADATQPAAPATAAAAAAEPTTAEPETSEPGAAPPDQAGSAGSGAGTSSGAGAEAVRALLPGATAIDYDPAAVRGDTLGGARFDGAAVDGPIVYWFWAPWCTICRAESGHVAATAEQFDEVTFVGVAGLGPLQDMTAFVSETGVDGFEHVSDVDGTVWATFGVVGQPSYVVVDAGGEATLWPGGLGADQLEAVTAALVG